MLNQNAQPAPLGTRRDPPGPAGYPLVGVIPQIGADPLRFFVNVAAHYGGVTLLRLGPRRSYLISDPAALKYVLQDNNRNYAKGYDQVKPLFGNGLLTSEGDFWRRQRRLIQPAFHHQQLASFATTMTDYTAQMLERWRAVARRGEALDVAAEMMGLTQRIILDTMFSADIDEKNLGAISRAFDAALNHFDMATFSPFGALDWLPTAENRRYQRALRFLDETVYGMIASRRDNHRDENDLLTMLMNTRDADDGEGMSDRQIRDEIVTIFLAGHETTATTLSWAWHLLSQHPEIEAQLRAEHAAVLGGRTPAVQDLPALTCTRRVIDETLRMYPPAWMFARRAINADVVGGYDIPAGAMLMLSPYVTHHLPSLWDEPDRFDPERFRPENAGSRHRFAYMPFSGGPRICIGNNFALMESQLIMAMVAQNFTLRMAPGHTVLARPRATLRPQPGVVMTLHE